MIILTNDRSKSEERIKEKLNQFEKSENPEALAKIAFEEIDINIQAVKEVFKGFYSEIISTTKTDTIDEIAVIFF